MLSTGGSVSLLSVQRRLTQCSERVVEDNPGDIKVETCRSKFIFIGQPLLL